MQEKTTTTLQDKTYQTLHQWLTVGRFLPGERLKIRQVADELGVGVTPVRAALQRLAAEGALLDIPNCGMMVPKLNRAQFDDILQIRQLLEGQAAEQGAYRMSDAGIATMAALTQEMARAIAASDCKAYLEANEAFHVTLYRAGGSPLLMELIETIWLKVGPISNQLFEDGRFALKLNDAHEDVLAALKQRDGARVRRAIEQDMFYAGQHLKSACL
ncbi:GntR family transcriptional regulator [Janthinobacterium sp. PC23-8]|uniref:GntR family transcriptional regulator n=1 Tax=Janthinobacterium sp. PC23-8 TaxID=2012679 RepID=UPI000B9708C0|nr:GntR family transcriptional regulator [Janthinobacterium sp. PC23-8]OYO28020.1 GntR family transcriptional regulator [Janthinobacterium sp. PC23-8]